MTPAQRRQAWKALLDNLDERTFTRGQYSVTIHDAGLVNLSGQGAVRIAFTLRRSGNVILQDEWVTFAPPTHVQDGEEPNPDHDPDDPASLPMRPIYRRDIREAFRAHFVDVMQGVIERRRAAR